MDTNQVSKLQALLGSFEVAGKHSNFIECSIGSCNDQDQKWQAVLFSFLPEIPDSERDYQQNLGRIRLVA